MRDRNVAVGKNQFLGRYNFLTQLRKNQESNTHRAVKENPEDATVVRCGKNRHETHAKTPEGHTKDQTSPTRTVVVCSDHADAGSCSFKEAEQIVVKESNTD